MTKLIGNKYSPVNVRSAPRKNGPFFEIVSTEDLVRPLGSHGSDRAMSQCFQRFSPQRIVLSGVSASF